MKILKQTVIAALAALTTLTVSADYSKDTIKDYYANLDKALEEVKA